MSLLFWFIAFAGCTLTLLGTIGHRYTERMRPSLEAEHKLRRLAAMDVADDPHGVKWFHETAAEGALISNREWSTLSHKMRLVGYTQATAFSLILGLTLLL